jgi:hypothetical protein
VLAAQHDAQVEAAEAERDAALAAGAAPPASAAAADAAAAEFPRALAALVAAQLVPALPRCLARAEPLPLYALTLLGTAAELCPSLADALHARGLGAAVPALMLRHARDGQLQPALPILLLRLLESAACERRALWDAGLPLLFATLLELAAPPSSAAAPSADAAATAPGGGGGGGGSALADATVDITVDAMAELLRAMTADDDGAGGGDAAVANFWLARAAELLPTAASLLRLCHHPDPCLAAKAARCALALARMCGEGGRAAAPGPARAAFVEGDAGAALRAALEGVEPGAAPVRGALLALLRAVLPDVAQ